MAKKKRVRDQKKLPGPYQAFIARFPEFAAAHESVGKAADRRGPLDPRSRELVKIGMCVGAGLESALRSHIRRGMEAGLTHVEIEQAILYGMNTVGFPRTVAAWTWAQVQFDRSE